ncbi:MAG: hypothetical protein JWP78_651 [Mucilaginibacter sp.]|nr:hypothetical protein [Mucilaginibacter sp.]
MKNLILSILLFTCCYSLALAQNDQLKFEHFTQKLGLPDSQTSFIKQHGQGYIRIGAILGLARYDGYQQQLHTLDKQHPDAMVLSMLEGHGGSISVDSKEREDSEFTINLPI